jgi:hypothetical protein
MARLKVKSWSDFQHYKDRSPPWIKLHKSLLDNFEYQRLPLASKALAPMFWLLASESEDGSIEHDVEKLAFRLRVSNQDIEDAITPLINNGFLVNAIEPLADCLQDACLETETETETDIHVGNDVANVPHQEIIALYHKHLPMLTQVRTWTDKRAKALKARWREDKKRQSLEFWEKLFIYIAQSDFLTGKASDWQADLEWIINPSNLVKIIEGKYENKP